MRPRGVCKLFLGCPFQILEESKKKKSETITKLVRDLKSAEKWIYGGMRGVRNRISSYDIYACCYAQKVYWPFSSTKLDPRTRCDE